MKFLGDTLIVVATNNGKENLMRSLPILTSIPHPVALVDTGSSRGDDREYLTWVERANENVFLLHTEGGYDTGAYLHAYRSLPFRRYLFLQDSMLPREPNFVEEMKKPLRGQWGVVAWVGFSIQIWDSAEQVSYIEAALGKPSRPNVNEGLPLMGIFGPNFLASHDALAEIESRNLLPVPPGSKEQAQGWERGWAMAFYRAGVPVYTIVQEYIPQRDTMSDGEYPIFTKLFRGRT